MLNTRILVGLYHASEEFLSLAEKKETGEAWWRLYSSTLEIAADWMQDAGATGDVVARMVWRLNAAEATPLRITAERIAGVLYRRENPPLKAEYDAAFAHLS